MSYQEMKDSVTSIWSCHQFQLDLGGDLICSGQGESLYGEKFSPISGSVFQLKFINLDNARFIIFLKNCGKESVNILQFEVRSDRAGKEVKKNNFSLLPEGVMALPDLVFKDFLDLAWCGLKYFKDFRCFLEIDTRGKTLVIADKAMQSDQACVSLGFLGDLRKELNNPNFADAVLVCQSEEIPCHRVILAARSDVFKKMFLQKDFHEGTTKKVQIGNLDVGTLKKILNFIYTDTFDTENAKLVDLFSASDMYGIHGLRDRCESLLIEDLSTSNAAEYFQLSSLHGASKLKLASMEVIARNLDEVAKSPEWTQLRNGPNGGGAFEEIVEFLSRKLFRNCSNIRGPNTGTSINL